jgi:hypothetical protein
MVFNASFNNISVISWRSVLLVEEIRVPGEIYGALAAGNKIINQATYKKMVHVFKSRGKNPKKNKDLPVYLPYMLTLNYDLGVHISPI